jgi:Protein of unknown function (DUF3105)
MPSAFARRGAVCFALHLLAAQVACSDDPASGPGSVSADGSASPVNPPRSPDASDAGVDAPMSSLPDAGSSCVVALASPPSEGAAHAPECTAVQYATNPPASGTHYGYVPVFRSYEKPVPWGFLLHAMEHGAVVLAYNCPGGCAEELAAAKVVVDAVPKKACERPPVIVTPDPGLPVRFAATSWGHYLHASCFDAKAFAAFIDAHMNQGPEFFPRDCGSTDREATGWCP